MIESHKALWDKCLTLIKDNVTEQQYNTWFSPIVFESFSEKDRTLLVQVPSPYVYEYLEEYYIGLLSKVLTRCFGNGVRLTYRIVADKTHGLTTDVQANDAVDIEHPQPTSRGNKSPSPLDAAVPQDLNPQLNPKHTFNNFIEGFSNKLPRILL